MKENDIRWDLNSREEDNRAQDHPRKEDDKSPEDLEAFRKIEKDRLSFFAV